MSTVQTPRTPDVGTKLPSVGTTIFTVMSTLAAEKNAVNLGQGFPDFNCDPKLLEDVTAAMAAGHNQYPPMPGIPALRDAIAAKISALYGHTYSAATEITVTAGATQAIITAILAVVRPGDEVIVLEPCYDSYVPNIELAGGSVVRVPLTPGTFRPDFDKIAAALTPRTRAIIVNTPHNPSATVWTEAEMRQLEELLAPTDVFVISDEVYEHMVFDTARHESVARFAGLAARSFIVSSFGKTYHVTGWKVGFVAAPAPLMAEFRKVHQFNVFTVNTPMQHALARYMADPEPYLELPAFYQRKRDLFAAGLAEKRASSCCAARAATSSASTSRRSATCRRPTSAFGSRARSAWRPFRCRPSTATVSTSGWCASASPRRTKLCSRHWSGWRASDTHRAGRRLRAASAVTRR
jgi:methionine aminotransferase